MLNKMLELFERRAERYTPLVVDKFPRVTEMQGPTWIGSYSWSSPPAHARWMQKGKTVDLFGGPQTPPEVGRDYLRAKYTEPRRHTTAQYQAINLRRSPPLYCVPGKYGDMAYVDLRAAYWSIMLAVGWDVDYHPSRWLCKRSDCADFPLPDHKVARNSLVTAGLMTEQIIWTGSGLKYVKGHNPLVNYDIWSLSQDVLHSIAAIALVAGAVYVHTDGYIIPDFMVDRFRNEVSRWGLTATVKARGDATVYGIGSYDIGEVRTKHRYSIQDNRLFNLYRPDIEFLLPRFRKLHS